MQTQKTPNSSVAVDEPSRYTSAVAQDFHIDADKLLESIAFWNVEWFTQKMVIHFSKSSSAKIWSELFWAVAKAVSCSLANLLAKLFAALHKQILQKAFWISL